MSKPKDRIRLEIVPINQIKPYEGNARKHSPDQIKRIRASMKEFGFLNPCLVDGQYRLIAGHGRLEAAQAEGYTEAPCVFVEHLTDEQRRAYILADNRLAELAEWDFEQVEKELAQITSIDMDLLGFGDDFLDYDPEDAAASKAEYSIKTNIPQYEITGDTPPLADLVDKDHATALLREIEAADLGEAEKEFLRLAAYRHIVFDYRNIAEYYAAAEPAMQRLMEQSALVIIDIGDAIKNGYAHLANLIVEQREDEYDDA